MRGEGREQQKRKIRMNEGTKIQNALASEYRIENKIKNITNKQNHTKSSEKETKYLDLRTIR